VLPSIVNEVLKGVVAQYNAIELIVKREQVAVRPLIYQSSSSLYNYFVDVYDADGLSADQRPE
jgi:hypothetical protein